MTSDQLTEMCAVGAPFVETAGYVPASTPDATETSVYVRVRRGNQSVLERNDGRKSQIVRNIEIVCFSTVHATYGGVVAPAVGDTWKLPTVYGGSNVEWKAGPARGEYGCWVVVLTRVEDIELGGNRRKS